MWEPFVFYQTYSVFSLFLVYLRAVGGEVGATSSLAPKIGPLGLVGNHHFKFYNYQEVRLKLLFNKARMLTLTVCVRVSM